MATKSQMCVVSPESIAKAVAKSATPGPGKGKPKARRGSGKRTPQGEMWKKNEFLTRLKAASNSLKNPEELKRLQQYLDSSTTEISPMAAGSQFGTRNGTFNNATVVSSRDPVTNLLVDVVDTASGVLGGVGGFASGKTMDIAEDLASGVVDTSGELAEGILGDTSEVLAGQMFREYGGGPRDMKSSRAGVSISVTVNAPEVCTACSAACTGAMEMVCSAMDKGIAKVQSLTSVVGNLNGAVDLLTSSIQKAIDMQIAKMMAKIMSMIETAHGITHPLFLAIFKMTWNENKQWVPEFIKSIVGDGSCIPKWMEPCKELVEYFDFVQEVMGGAINEVCKCCEKLFTDVVKAAGGLQVTLNAQIQVNFPIPNLCVPLMSISKQVEDLLKKVQIIKEIIRQKGRQVLEKLKDLQAPELFINVPSDFLLILEVLVEAEFIYANLHIVIDKILEFFINMFVEKFAGIASAIIDKIFSIWKKVVDIVPPLQDLLEMCWAIPNAADCCFNCALNIALPEMWSIIQPYIMMPFECIDMISQACDAATQLAYP